MIENLESQLRGCLVLKGLDPRIIKLDRPPALHTDHVIVVFVVVEVFVSRNAIGEIDLPRQTAFHENLHGAIHRRVSDAGILLTHHAVDILHAAVSLMVQENVQDQLAVRRELELAFLQVIHEHLHFRSKDFHRLLYGVGVVGGSSLTTSL